MNETQPTYERFSLARRIEHFLLILSFTTLAVTGLPQKFPLSAFANGMIQVMGGIETVRIIHRVAATVFLLEAIYHLVVMGYKLFILRLEASMGLSLKDVRDGLQAFGYNLGLTKQYPRMDRYNFIEKVEYWAMVWGLVIMAITGFMLWNPIAVTRLLPGQFIPAAKAAHGGEALLAVLAIVVWHFYNVHLRRWNPSMFTGRLPRDQMEEEHPLELEKIESGRLPVPLPPEVRRARLRLYTPIAAVLSMLLLYGVYRFVTFEETALKTVPPGENVAAFSPQTPTPLPTVPPTPTAVPGATQAAPAALTWEEGIGQIFQQKCGTCHGSLGGLSLKTYDDAMKGGAHGPVIVPGEPDNSTLVVLLQPPSKHPGQFSPEELEQIIAWIENGAPE